MLQSTVILTVLRIEQHLIEIRLIVVKGLSDFFYSLLISQVTIHETANREQGQQQSWLNTEVESKIMYNIFSNFFKWILQMLHISGHIFVAGFNPGYHTTKLLHLTCMCCSCAWPQLCGNQTACRIHCYCTQPATAQSEHFPKGNWSLKPNWKKNKTFAPVKKPLRVLSLDVKPSVLSSQMEFFNWGWSFCVATETFLKCDAPSDKLIVHLISHFVSFFFKQISINHVYQYHEWAKASTNMHIFICNVSNHII